MIPFRDNLKLITKIIVSICHVAPHVLHIRVFIAVSLPDFRSFYTLLNSVRTITESEAPAVSCLTKWRLKLDLFSNFYYCPDFVLPVMDHLVT